MPSVARSSFIAIEIAILTALILATRCANYQDVFVRGSIYFTDADCYARMTRVRMCAQHPGLIIRHHDFENFPTGTTPHTTAPLDYLILGLSKLLSPVTAQPIELGGALISPILALLTGWFLWWWSTWMGFRYRWVLLILFAISPISVHGTELGRPDHQSLATLLVTIAICAEWALRRQPVIQWSIVSGVAWAIAIWVSAYEPLILFLVLTLVMLCLDRYRPADVRRRPQWVLFFATLLLAFLIERRIFDPTLLIFHPDMPFRNWAATIGELSHVSPLDSIWLHWAGYLVLAIPFLIWFRFRIRTNDSPGRSAFLMVGGLLVVTYFLTIWQARWGYYFLLFFALTLPVLLESIRSRTAVWIAFALSLWPVLKDWDDRVWPNDVELARRLGERIGAIQVRNLAVQLQSNERHAFLAPWWLSPSIAYWSGQPGVAGSSHESQEGIQATAEFFNTNSWARASEILKYCKAEWVVAYDSDRVAVNSATLLGRQVTGHELCSVLDRTPTQVPPFLILSAQNGVAKLYRVANNL